MAGIGRGKSPKQLASGSVPPEIVIDEWNQRLRKQAVPKARGIVFVRNPMPPSMKPCWRRALNRCRTWVASPCRSNAAPNLYVVLSARGIAPACRLMPVFRIAKKAERKLLPRPVPTQVVSPLCGGAGAPWPHGPAPPGGGVFMDLPPLQTAEVEDSQLSEEAPYSATSQRPQPAKLELGRALRRHGAGDFHPAPKVGTLTGYRVATLPTMEEVRS